TALSQAEDKTRADKLGADRYLVKSQVTLEDVAAVAKEVLTGEQPAVAAPAVAQESALETPEAPAPVATPPTPPATTSIPPVPAAAAVPPPPPADPVTEPPTTPAPATDPTPVATPDP